ncbi:hypothetical protein PanWU01x14_198080 [Parasponia andersonii]|uniref:Uncharacterized protein n=1 Tax=Parasponia andersonii TaxID=3476 RepID=A0A2P5BZ48_PARAD|nr:hypothetical protein PanWU01x14_198080 [Parasponia andersonii]
MDRIEEEIKQREILDWALTTVEESENNLNSLVELCSESSDNLQSMKNGLERELLPIGNIVVLFL